MKYRFGIYLNFTHKKKGGMFFRVLVFVFSLCCNWSNDFLDETGEPLVIGDGAVAILVHLLEESSLLLSRLVGGRQPQPLLGRGGDIDHRAKLLSRHLAVPVSVCRLETLPREPVDFLV